MSRHQSSDSSLERAHVEVAQAIQELRTTVEDARSMPMSQSAVVNRAELLEQIDELQATLAEAFTASDEVFSARDHLVQEARNEAERIVADAYSEREKLVSETDVYKIAKRESEQLRSAADADAAALRHETDEYVDQRLANLEIALNKTLDAVSRGRDRLHGRSGLDELDDAERNDDEPPFRFPGHH